MNDKETYIFYRDNLAVAIAKMADKFDEYKINDSNFEDIFRYTLIQLKNFDNLWDKIFNK